MTLGQRLKNLREDKDMTREQLAKALCITYSALAKYETDVRTPDHDTLRKVAEYFKVSVDWLMGLTENSKHSQISAAKTVTIPVLGTIRAGVPILAEDNWEGEVDVPAKLKAEFALRVTGDSMSWAGIHEGDLAILKRTDTVSNGMIVAAGIEESTWEATLKYYIKENGHTVLRAANPEYSDVTYTPDHRVIGYTVAVLKDPPSYNTYKNLLMRKDITDRKWQLAVEMATQAGLDGEQVASLIGMFASSVRTLKKS